MRVSDFHPLLNHFSIALVAIGILVDFAGRYTKRPALESFAWNCTKIGFGVTFLSILTGFIAEATAHLELEARSITDYHKTISFLLVGILGAAIIIRATGKSRFDDEQKGAGIRAVYYTMTTISFVLLAINMFLGSELVYSHGVNVRPYERIINDLPPTSSDSVLSPSIEAEKPNGDSLRSK